MPRGGGTGYGKLLRPKEQTMADMFADLKKQQAEQPTPKPGPAPAPAPAAPTSVTTAATPAPAAPPPGLQAEQPRDKAFRYLYKGAFTLLEVDMPAGGRFKAESDAMVAMSPTIDVEGKLEGGVLGGLGRMLSGETFFFQTLDARRGPGTALLAPAIPGDIHHLELDGSVDYVLQKDGFFAGSDTLTVTTKMQNLAQGFLSREGFFVLRVSGQGTLFVASYGAIHPIDIPAGEQMIIDNGHLVAWPATMNYTLEKAAKGWLSSFTSGEGIVCRFTGPGRVLIQSRNPAGFAAWIRGMMPQQRR
jgi:uncharacterized protein (TIGR00266 family)